MHKRMTPGDTMARAVSYFEDTQSFGEFGGVKRTQSLDYGEVDAGQTEKGLGEAYSDFSLVLVR